MQTMFLTQAFLFTLAGVVGLAFGSFGNVLLVRFAEGSDIGGRSRCPKCHHKLSWFDLVPVVSFLLLRGKCRYCPNAISRQYPLVEIASAALFILAYYLFPEDPVRMGSTTLVLWGLLLVSIYDFYYLLIPDLFTAFVFIGAATFSIATWSVVPAAFGSLIAFLWFGIQWAVSSGRFVGSGDILIAASLGFWLGIRGTITMLFLSYIIGAIVAVYLLIKGRAEKGSHLPFGPFLAIGAVLAFLGVGDFYFDLLLPT